MKKILLCASALTLACVTASPVFADDYDHGGKAWHDKDSGKMMMMGKHGMAGTVESIDHQTGWLKVKTGEGSLNVHFPPDAIKELKEGDKITVHLSFTKGEEMKGMEMKEKEMKGMEMKDKMMK